MNTKQLLLITLIQAIVTILIFPFVPAFIEYVSNGSESINNLSEAYRIIFMSGIITILIFGLILMGKKEKNEWYFTFSALAFLAIIFYKNFSTMPLQTTISLIIASVIFRLRSFLRKIVIKNNILT